MKKTVNVNVGGFPFHIDEEAYEKLKNYLDDIEVSLSKEENSKEILADIEGRIAELFKKNISDTKEVITISDVEDVIAILGTPEDISGNSEERHKSSQNRQRKLYRDSKKRYFGGVCAGLAIYFDIPLWLVRTLFVVFVFIGGFSLLIYFLLWLLVPEAKTTSQKIEMEGQPVNVDNIASFVKQEFETVKKTMNL